MDERREGARIRHIASCAFTRARRLSDLAVRSTACEIKRSWRNGVCVIMRIAKLLTAGLLSGVLSGCAVGPNYHRPAVQTPISFRDLADNPQLQAQTASYADLRWWQVFQDTKLQELIRTALKQNYDLQLATERINAARAQLAVTRSNLFPQISGNANFSGGKENVVQSRYNFLTLTADAAFQLDFFCRLRRANEAARAQLLATEDARDRKSVV